MADPRDIWLVVISLFISGSTFASPNELTQEARAVIESLPGKTLTPELVIQRAAEKTTSFRSLLTQALNVEALKHEGDAPYNLTIKAEVQKGDDQREPNNPFMPSRSRSESAEMGASKYFASGTSVEAKVTTGRTDLEFANPAANDLSLVQSNLVVNVAQSLWKDGFGKAGRLRRSALYTEADAAKLRLSQQIQDWTIGILNLYYRAWVAQQSALAAQKNLERRMKLESIIRVRNQRGTSEEADLLQVTAATNTARNEKNRADQEVQDIWNSLVVTLEFPDHWRNISALMIPLKLDDPVPEALNRCKKPETKETLEAMAAAKEFRASEERLNAAQNALAPDVQLVATYGLNGVDPRSQGSTFRETLQGDNPAWAVGLKLSLPIENDAAKAEIKTSIAKKAKAEADQIQARDKSILDWREKCATLKRLQSSNEILAENSRLQQNRARQEERRYSLGRTTVLAYTQSQDDAAAAELASLEAQATVRRQAWEILKLDHQILDRLGPLIANLEKQAR